MFWTRQATHPESEPLTADDARPNRPQVRQNGRRNEGSERTFSPQSLSSRDVTPEPFDDLNPFVRDRPGAAA